MSNQIFEMHVDERGNPHVQVSQKFTVLTQEQTQEIIEKVDRMRNVCIRMHEHIKECCDVCDEDFCSSWDEDNGCCVFDSYMQELGIEVEK